jgi:hypothetical protein
MKKIILGMVAAFALTFVGSVAKAEDAPAGDAPAKAEKKGKKGKKEKKADDKGAEGGDKK